LYDFICHDKNAICTKFRTGAVVRYYGDWKWCCSYTVCHKPIKFGYLVGNKLYLTIIMTFIPIEGKSKSYKHRLIIYWTALVNIFMSLLFNLYLLFCYVIVFDVLNNINEVFVFKFVLFVSVLIYVCHV